MMGTVWAGPDGTGGTLGAEGLAPQIAGALRMQVPSARDTGGIASIEAHPEWPLLGSIPMRLTVRAAFPGFKVRDLVGLTVGLVFRSKCASNSDLPLYVGDVQLSWSEFEVVEHRLAVRITRLA